MKEGGGHVTIFFFFFSIVSCCGKIDILIGLDHRRRYAVSRKPDKENQLVGMIQTSKITVSCMV